MSVEYGLELAGAMVGVAHAERVLSFLPPGGRMLQWGAGPASVWFADHLPSGAVLTIVEHDRERCAAVAAALGPRDTVRLVCCPADAPVGPPDTWAAEDPSGLDAYVRAAVGSRYDVLLVDGHARGACMMASRESLTATGVVCLHDAQRAWYDEVKQAFRCWGVVGASPEDGVSHLWIGGRSSHAVWPTAGRDSRIPVVISYYTVDSPYEEGARRLMARCDELGIEHDVVARPVLETWDATVAQKARVCLEAWQRYGRPILWVDSDAELLDVPALLADCPADAALFRANDVTIAGGTLFFGQTPLAHRLLARWVERCEAEPQVLDQVSLDLAWEEVTAREPLYVRWLPAAYCQILDAPRDGTQPSVIVHGQASRRTKSTFKRAPRPQAQPSEAIYRARLAARPRQWMTRAVPSLEWERSQSEEQLLDAVLPGRVPLAPTAAPPGANFEGWWVNATTNAVARAHAERELIETCLGEITREIERCRHMLHEARLEELVPRLARLAPAPFAIYGAGAVGQALLHLVRQAGLAPFAFIESQPTRHGATVDGLSIIGLDACRAAGCHVYAIASFSSSGPIADAVAAAYAGSGAVDCQVLKPASSATWLPNLATAAPTLQALLGHAWRGRLINEFDPSA